MIKENLERVLVKNSQIQEQLKADDGKEQDFEIELQDTKDGNKTIYISRNGKKSYMHSKYGPLREAERLIDKYRQDIEGSSITIFYGVGLGYHIDEFTKKYPNKRYYIYEPLPKLMKVYLEEQEIRAGVLNNAEGISTGNFNFWSNYLLKEKVVLITLPSHEKLFNEAFTEFKERTAKITSATRDSVVTNLAYQNRWILNSIKNLKHVLRTPNIIDKKYTGEFKDKPVIILAAGPSLNEDIEHIRRIKEKGLAYIFSVGSAINTLIHNDILPDATFTYDPKERNRKVFTKFIEKKIKDIPVVFGSSIGYEVLEDLDNIGAEKVHFITSQDTIARSILKRVDGEKNLFVEDAPSIAVLTLSIAQTLGCNPIIFAGQNLAFKDDKRHSEGVDYSKEVSEAEKASFIETKDVYGNIVSTDRAFEGMKNSIEHHIGLVSDRDYINTTKGGADIVGTKFTEIEKLIEESLRESIVVENVFDSLSRDIYDLKHLKKRKDTLKTEWIRARNIIGEYEDTSMELNQGIELRNTKNIKSTYPKLDKIFKKIENNEYFKIFILPTVRVQYKALMDSLGLIKAEKNMIRQGAEIYIKLVGVLEAIEKSRRDIDRAYEEMIGDIESYIEE